MLLDSNLELDIETQALYGSLRRRDEKHMRLDFGYGSILRLPQYRMICRLSFTTYIANEKLAAPAPAEYTGSKQGHKTFVMELV
jgi:hypothetical protein